MTVKMKLEGLCCPNCAAKIEAKVSALPQVESACLNFLTEKLILEIGGETEELCKQVEKIVHKIEPSVKIRYL